MWYRAFGWLENPFSIKPTPNVIGLEETKEALLQDLRSGSPALLLGPTGMGKTSLLLWLRDTLLDTPFTPVYLNLHALPAPQEEMLRARLRLAFLLRRFRLSSGAILLADEAQALQPQAAEWLKAMFDQGPLFSFALAAPEEPPLPPPLRARLGPHVYYLQELSLPERIALLKHRMAGKNPFTEEALTLLAEAAGSSPRALLQAAELACKRLAFKAELREPISPADLLPLLPARQTATRKTIASLAQDTPYPPDRRDNAETAKESMSQLVSGPLSVPGQPTRETNATKIDETQLGTVSRAVEMPRAESPVPRSLALSPMQLELLRVLRQGPKDVQELSALLGSPPGSVRRQLSRLRQPGPGLPPLVQDLPGSSPKKFSLTDHGQKTLNPTE